MNRRGQGISINIVIIAVIALIVLVVAIVLVTKTGRNVDQNTGGSSCLAQGGSCMDAADCNVASGYRADTGTNCQQESKVCCIYDFRS